MIRSHPFFIESEGAFDVWDAIFCWEIWSIGLIDAVHVVVWFWIGFSFVDMEGRRGEGIVFILLILFHR